MGRSARLAVGAVAAAVAGQQVGTNLLGAVVALAMATLLVAGAVGPRHSVRGTWPVVIGAGLIVVRLAVLLADPEMLQRPPEGDGPWTLVVLAT